MIALNGVDFEINTMAANPKFGYVDEFREYPMLSGKIRRDIKGKRFSAEIAYGYLTDLQIASVYDLLDAQKTAGYLTAEITMPGGTFEGNVFLSVNNSQSRYYIKDGVGCWTNWRIILTGVDLV